MKTKCAACQGKGWTPAGIEMDYRGSFVPTAWPRCSECKGTGSIDCVVNQCDGCMAGIPAINGVHRMGRPDGYPDYMSCTKDLYIAAKESG